MQKLLKQLEQTRKKNGTSYYRIAKDADLSQTHVKDILNGKGCNLDTFCSIAKALNLDINLTTKTK